MQATEIKERPIIFSTPMIKAILDGKKSQTRRVLKLRKGDTVGRIYDDKETEYIICDKYGDIVPIEFVSPYGVWDDRLWVKETHYRYGLWEPCENQDNETAYTFQPLSEEIRYFNNPPQVVLKGYGGAGWYKRPSIFMPRKASRITLEVTDLRIQMVQQISPEDAIAEGAEYMPSAPLRKEPLSVPQIVFAGLWDKLNAPRGYSWESNPFVWAISFRVIKPEAK